VFSCSNILAGVRDRLCSGDAPVPIPFSINGCILSVRHACRQLVTRVNSVESITLSSRRQLPRPHVAYDVWLIERSHSTAESSMDSGQVLLTRHAEKPSDPEDPNLSPVGSARAEKLPEYIRGTFGKPDFLFASAISEYSRRPWETIEPLSRACGEPIDASFADQDYEALAHGLLTKPRFENKLIIVCWHHGHIPSFAKALGAKCGSYPDPWDPEIFNLILKLAFSGGKLEVKQFDEPF
jgi:hypothetical protein